MPNNAIISKKVVTLCKSFLMIAKSGCDAIVKLDKENYEATNRVMLSHLSFISKSQLVLYFDQDNLIMYYNL